MARSVQRFVGASCVAALLVMFAASTAGAQTAVPEGPCTFAIVPNSVPSGATPVTVQVDGKAPVDSTVRIFAAGVPTGTTTAIGGVFQFLVEVQKPADVVGVTVNYETGEGNAYATGCQGGIVDPGGTSVVAGATAERRALAFTGSNTGTYVLIAAVAVLLGIVLVIATRRRLHAQA